MIWDGIVPLSTVGKPEASFFTLRDTHHFSPEDQFGTKCSQAGRFFISLNNSFLVFRGGGGVVEAGLHQSSNKFKWDFRYAYQVPSKAVGMVMFVD